MRKFRVGMTGLAVTAIAAMGAAPASAQVGNPCTPGIPVDTGVDCVFENAKWVVAEAADPVPTIRQVQATVNAGIATAQAETVKALQLVDNAQKFVVGQTCYVLGIEPTNCPQI